jgi:hypothetical protein
MKINLDFWPTFLNDYKFSFGTENSAYQLRKLVQNIFCIIRTFPIY